MISKKLLVVVLHATMLRKVKKILYGMGKELGNIFPKIILVFL